MNYVTGPEPLLLALALILGCLLQAAGIGWFGLRVKRGQAVGLLPWRLAAAGIILICLRAFYEADFVLLLGELLLLYGAKRLLT